MNKTLTLTAFVMVAVVMGLSAFTPAAMAGGPSKVTICHIPPGDPSDLETLTVSTNALPAHLAHGDTLGPCVD